MKTRNEAVRAALLAACLALAAGCGDKMPIVAGKKSPSYRTAPIARTDIVRTASATGSVTPRNSSKGIPVGAQVNGKLIKLYVDYNDVVTNGQVVAEIDPLVYKANYKSAVARLHMSNAGVMTSECSLRQREAELVLAQKTYDRQKAPISTARRSRLRSRRPRLKARRPRLRARRPKSRARRRA